MPFRPNHFPNDHNDDIEALLLSPLSSSSPDPASIKSSSSKSTTRIRDFFKRPIVRIASILFIAITASWFLYPYVLLLSGRERYLPASHPPPPPPPGGPFGDRPPPPPPGDIEELEDEPSFPTPSPWDARKLQVKAAYQHALKGYMTHAFPNDELAPISGNFTNKYNHWALSLVDSLDTMYLLGLHDEFNHGLSYVSTMNFTLPPGEYIPFFETTIRYLGGLLSAHALSGSPILLSKADELGAKLLPAFNGTLSGLPATAVDPVTGLAKPSWTILFAEMASCQLEFKYLAKLTGKKDYYEKAENVMRIIYGTNVSQGLFPESWSGETGSPVGEHLSAGASADSGYEYMLKQYLLTGDTNARDQYITSANGIIDNLLYISPNRSLLYATDLSQGIDGYPTHRYEHLTCFLPGTLALGARTVHTLSEKDKERHMWAARGLAYTCYISYADQGSGLGPDVWEMVKGRKWVDVLKEWEEGSGLNETVKMDLDIELLEGSEGQRKKRDKDVPPGLGEPPKERMNETVPWYEKKVKRDYYNWSEYYMLRPETIESLFLLWKATGEEKWRERGWEIFQALEEHSKTEYGYANVLSIDSAPYRQDDDMPSWFLAETLKYFYLLFDNSEPISLDKWVLNTEAHPLPKFTWTEWEKKLYNITY